MRCFRSSECAVSWEIGLALVWPANKAFTMLCCSGGNAGNTFFSRGMARVGSPRLSSNKPRLAVASVFCGSNFRALVKPSSALPAKPASKLYRCPIVPKLGWRLTVPPANVEPPLGALLESEDCLVFAHGSPEDTAISSPHSPLIRTAAPSCDSTALSCDEVLWIVVLGASRRNHMAVL